MNPIISAIVATTLMLSLQNNAHTFNEHCMMQLQIASRCLLKTHILPCTHLYFSQCCFEIYHSQLQACMCTFDHLVP